VRHPERDIRLLRIAEDDLTELVAYISADQPAAADLVLARIEKGLARLMKHPHLGRIPKEDDLARLGYRYIVVDDYLIFYTVEGEAIYVHRILHGARDYLRSF
jgi:toxin ParE1/3/4